MQLKPSKVVEHKGMARGGYTFTAQLEQWPKGWIVADIQLFAPDGTKATRHRESMGVNPTREAAIEAATAEAIALTPTK